MNSILKRIVIELTGISPIMLHNERLANPRDPLTAALRKLTSQRKKTDELLDEIAKREWFAGLYESGGKVVVPADNILACIKEGARKRKLGKQAEAGLFSEARNFPLKYDGPADIEKLWEDGRFFDYRSVAVNQARTMRARPRFDEWSLTFELFFDPEVLSESDLKEAIETAGTLVGLCEKRPQFGRFVSKVVETGNVAKAA